MMIILRFNASEKKDRSKKKSFTLVEILVAVSLGVMILIGIFQAFNSGQSAWLTGQGSSELRLEIIKALTRMDSEIRGSALSHTNLMGTCVNSLIFNLPINVNGTVLDSSDHIIWSSAITYSLNANGQIIRNFSGVNSVLANNITSLQFCPPSIGTSTVSITAAKRANNRRQMQDSGQINITMRNI